MLRRQDEPAPPELPPPGSAPSLSPLWLVIWISIQLIALSVGAMQAPLSARYPEPAERLALHVMVVVQVMAVGLLFPVLLRGRGQSMMVTAAVWPFVQLAGYLSGQPAAVIFACALYVSLWLGVLATWRHMLRALRARMLGVAVVALISPGGALLWYLRMEFGPVPEQAGAVDAGWLGPIVGGVAVVAGNAAAWSAWVLLLVASVATGLVFLGRRLRHFIH